MRTNHFKIAAPIAAIIILAGFTAETWSRPTPADAEPYHKRVREAEAALPKFIESNEGIWLGQDEETPASAINLLNPNVIYSRSFTRNGKRADILIVHCKDARDIYGHYPPNCYPNSGYTYNPEHDADAKTWTIDGLEISGTVYHFSNKFRGRKLIVYNFIPLPNGLIMRDMTEVRRRAWDFTKRFHGGAQVQVVFADADATEEWRDDVFKTLIEAHLPLIREITGEIQ